MGPAFVECPTCGGEGGWDVPTHINRTNGGWDGFHRTCPTCDGAGSVEEEQPAMTLDEALELDAEKLAVLMADDEKLRQEMAAEAQQWAHFKAQEWADYADYDRDC